MLNNREKKNIIYYYDKFIIGKSDLKSDNYDILYFSRRDIKTANIPSFIKRIASNAFEGCYYLRQIEFDENLELVEIDDYIFIHQFKKYYYSMSCKKNWRKHIWKLFNKKHKIHE